RRTSRVCCQSFSTYYPLSIPDSETVAEADAHLKVVRRLARSCGRIEEAEGRLSFADDGVACVEADDGARGRIELKDAARIEREVVMLGLASGDHAAAATVEAGGEF